MFHFTRQEKNQLGNLVLSLHQLVCVQHIYFFYLQPLRVLPYTLHRLFTIKYTPWIKEKMGGEGGVIQQNY